MLFHNDGELPLRNLPYELRNILVFGSNTAGIHGAGAAKVAHEHFGAVWGKGSGLYGDSYAIPTKDRSIETLPLVLIKPYVTKFVEMTMYHDKIKFFVTAVGTGLAGYSDMDIAPMFKGVSDSCNMPIQWKEFLLWAMKIN